MSDARARSRYGARVTGGVVVRRFGELVRARGVGYALGRLALAGREVVVRAVGRPLARLARGGTFDWEGETRPLFVHPYNTTWRNERAVEIPLVWGWVQEAYAEGQRVLEVGHVLGHYLPTRHPVIDRFERAPGVANADVAEYDPDQSFDLIVSISTLEHVGFDEGTRDPAKAPAAVARLVSLLAPGGRLVATAPLGYNPDFDRLLRSGGFAFTRVRYLLRQTRTHWRTATPNEVAGVRYGAPFPGGNAIAVAEHERLSHP
jgi:hypothetical protein